MANKTIERRYVPEIFAAHTELSLYSVLSTDLRQNELGSSAPDLIFSEARHHSRGQGSRVCSPRPSKVSLTAPISEHDCRLCTTNSFTPAINCETLDRPLNADGSKCNGLELCDTASPTSLSGHRQFHNLVLISPVNSPGRLAHLQLSD